MFLTVEPAGANGGLSGFQVALTPNQARVWLLKLHESEPVGYGSIGGGVIIAHLAEDIAAKLVNASLAIAPRDKPYGTEPKAPPKEGEEGVSPDKPFRVRPDAQAMALQSILDITGRTQSRPWTALSLIDTIARAAL